MAAAGGSKIAIYGAIAGNFLVAVMKFVASFFTGSSAMLSEGIHSLIDTSNGLLLLYGIKQSKQKPDVHHPFGYGKEIYFWSFVVAIFIFAMGGGVAIYEGILHVMHPVAQDESMMNWNYGVLIGAIFIESATFYVAYRQFRKAHQQGIITSIRKSKDAATFAVLIEDAAAVTGLLFALIGVGLAHYTGNPVYDGAASIAIGLLLTSVSFFLARETKALLIGESATEEDIKLVEEVINKYPIIKDFRNIKTMHMGPDEILLALEVDFIDSISSVEVEACIGEIDDVLKERNPKFNKIYIEANNFKEE